MTGREPGRVNRGDWTGQRVRLGGGERLMMRAGNGTRGQGTLEYILLIAAVIVALLVGINSFIRQGANKTIDDSGTIIKSAKDKFTAGMKLNQ